MVNADPTRDPTTTRDPPRPLLQKQVYSGGADPVFRYVDPSGIRNSSIDPTLSFLPLSQGLEIFDCCNGLVLCCCSGGDVSFVCNPLTKSWTQFGAIDGIALLDFDPKLSPHHFKIVNFEPDMGSRSIMFMRVYSSETLRWTYIKIVIVQSLQMMQGDRHHAYWKGYFYSLCSTLSYCFGDSGRIARYDLAEGEGEGYYPWVKCQPILTELPSGTEKLNSAFMARWRDKLCLVGYDSITTTDDNELLRVRVWSLSKTDQTVWVMEHDCNVAFGLPRGHTHQPQVLGFHPYLDVVFILRGDTMHSFDLNDFSLNEVCPSRT